MGGLKIQGGCKLSTRMSKEIREAIRKFAHSGVCIYSTMFAKQFPFSLAVHENVVIGPI